MIFKKHLRKLVKYRLINFLLANFRPRRVTLDDINLVQVDNTINNVLVKLKSKEKVNICFIVTMESKWKYHLVYEKLRLESWVENAVIAVVPNTFSHHSVRDVELKRTVLWFQNNGYEVLNTRVAGKTTEVNIQREFSPDIVFYSDPYPFVGKKNEITKIYKKSLCCYSQYSFMILNNYELFYNLPFHNHLWRFFAETNFHKNLSIKYAKNKGKNVIVTGYPYADILNNPTNIKQKVKRNKIIWAPHHTITTDTNQRSNFIALSSIMKSIVKSYIEIDFVFKPHPHLINRLCDPSLAGWGEEKAVEYYNWWRQQDNTSIQEGGYTELFFSSDALIHDSASFTLEYLLTGKPALFNLNRSVDEYDLNELGKAALTTSYLGNTEKDIVDFIEDVVIKGNDGMIDVRLDFIQNHLNVSEKESASQKIVDHIKLTLCK
jgi:hypothetical protein